MNPIAEKMEVNDCDTSLEVLLKDFPDLNKDDPLVSKNCKMIEQGNWSFFNSCLT